MREEFEVYGLPPSFMFAVGAVKISLAALLIAGLWFPMLTQPAAIALAMLMGGAVAMHLKVKNRLKRSVPAMAIFVLCTAVAAF